MTEDQVNLFEFFKTKQPGLIKKTLNINANGVQFLNGDECFRYYRVPLIMIDYEPPATAKPFAQGERLAFWFKIEGRPEIQQQLKKSLREMTFWFDLENKNKILEFMQGKIYQK